MTILEPLPGVKRLPVPKLFLKPNCPFEFTKMSAGPEPSDDDRKIACFEFGIVGRRMSRITEY